MQFCESETVELKAVVVDDVKKEVAAFANCQGGVLYIGVNDEGDVVGVPNADETIRQVSSMVRDSIRPDVTMFVHYEALDIDDLQVIAIQVQRGANRPYYLAHKGLRPEGVYVRQGTSTVPATDLAIRQMIKETDGDHFEEMRSMEQALSFEAANKEFDRRRIAFGPQQKKTLGILNADGIYTNLGILLSDQCVHTIKAACFEGTDQAVFRDRREFTGSLLRQLNEVYDYIDKYNQTRSTFQKLLRIDSRDYPEAAVREALLNALVHRDYGYRDSTLVKIYSDRMEFISIGGLLPGVSLEDVMVGLSVCRNPKLADVFYRLELIEVYGTGMQKIMEAYAQSAVRPIIEVTANAFKVVLPNLNAAANNPAAYTQEPPEDHMQTILDFARERNYITRRDVEAALGVSQSAAGRLLRDMLNAGSLIQTGKGKSTRYRLP